jgi:two-component system, LuxR family, response regulator FixJ
MSAQPEERWTVIVVDDDAALRDSFRFSLEIDGFNVRAYADASELLAASDFPENCCFVIDQNIPGMAGLDLIEALRKRDVATPTILITSHPNATVRERASKAGVSIAEKPLLGSGLVPLIRLIAAKQHNDTKQPR